MWARVTLTLTPHNRKLDQLACLGGLGRTRSRKLTNAKGCKHDNSVIQIPTTHFALFKASLNAD